MKNRTSWSAAGGRLELRATERGTFTEYHITGTVGRRRGHEESADAIFSSVAGALAEEGIQPIQEKVYGLTRVQDDVMRRRAAAYARRGLDAGVPVTWVEGAPADEGDFGGVQVWGIAPRGGGAAVTTIRNGSTGTGRCWTGNGFRMVYLPFVRGTEADGKLPADHARQAERMFVNAGAGLREHGLGYGNVIRTWIYLARLLDWYGDLNRVRTALFGREHIGAEGGPAFPASTGIQGRHLDEECFMDVLALETLPSAAAIAAPVRRSPRQDSSFNYGSAFSRGMTLDIEGKRTVHISGTASINTAGATVHVGDAEGQSLETLMSIAAILEEQGGGLQNITMSTLFCKDHEAYEAWQRVTRLLKVPAFPSVCVRADVCRPDLLVEMEAVAVI
ncbi:MAG: hypothetical protein HYY18_03360 [Planctomycetes bacterium]|nr:hypothetical protein [Planctomycetota bacterium]